MADDVTFAGSDWGLDPRLLKAVMRLGFIRPTLVQAQCIPLALQGKDLLVRARTGSGKTAAYGLPVLHTLLQPGSTGEAGPRAVVLVPTRELVEQVRRQLEELMWFCRDDLAVLGLAGDDTKLQAARLRDDPQLLVATPAKLVQHLEAGTVAGGLRRVRCFVVDEADLVLSFGYADDVSRVCAALPRICQGFLMSATLNEELQRLKRVVLHAPVVLKLHEGARDGKLAQYFVNVTPADKLLLVYVFLKLGVLSGKGLFFVDTVENCYRLKLFLEAFHIRSAVLNEELPLNSRLHILQDFNRGVFDFLIATDDAVEGGDGASEADVSGDEEQDVLRDLDKPAEIEEAIADAVDPAGAGADAVSSDEEKGDEEDDADEGGEGSEESEAQLGDADSDNDDDDDDDDEGAEDDEDAMESSDADGSRRQAGAAGDAAAESSDEEESTDGEGEQPNADAAPAGEEDISATASEENEPSGKRRKKRRDRRDTAASLEKLKDKGSKARHLKEAGIYGVARGVDFREVDFVVNVDMPRSAASYTHRVGRTARAGRSGTALSLVHLGDDVDAALLEEIQESQPPLPAGEADPTDPLLHMDMAASMAQAPEALQAQPCPLPFDLKEIATFRYRVEDVKRSVTRVAIKEARAAELKQEMLNSERLQHFFEDNPQDLQLLRHDKTVLHPTRVQDHLKHVPEYLIPDGIEVGDDPSLKKKKRKRHRGKFSNSAGGSDPLRSYSTGEGPEGKAKTDERVFSSTKRLGYSTSRRRKWKERHRKGEFAKRDPKALEKKPKKAKMPAYGGF